MISSICENPDVLSAMLIINSVIKIIKILVPVFLILTIINFFKATVNDNDFKKAVQVVIVRFIIAAFIFFIPNFIEAVISLTPADKGYMNCFTNATKENISKFKIQNAQKSVKKAEDTLDYSDYKNALYDVNRLDNGSTKTNLLGRLENVKTVLDDEIERKIKEYEKEHKNDYNNDNPGTSLSNDGSQSSSGNGVAQAGVLQTSEPDPSAAINYWKNVLNPSNFIYPKDSATGLPLGAWPVNYQSIPTQLTGYKIHNGAFVFPTTPVNNSYHFVYDHLGMDIMAVFGTPIYSPVDGSLTYSEWGHTLNKGGDETAYTVSIKLNSPVTVNGKQIQNVFMTHMSGIRYRCSWGACNRSIKKGELIGFVGNAAGSATSIGYAPHLHITLFNVDYDDGLYTNATEAVFDLPANSSGYSIVAGG